MIQKGRDLYLSSGCTVCHEPSPENVDLSHVGSRIEPGWTYAFIQDPRAFIPATTMEDLDLSTEDALAVVAYLVSLK